jgi:hypothetical protein
MSNAPENRMIKGLGEAYRRHIIVDNIGKRIYIEVQLNPLGQPKEKEYYEMKNGMWWKYVPEQHRDEFAAAINGGFEVIAMLNTGAFNEEYYVIQVVDLVDKKNAIA